MTHLRPVSLADCVTGPAASNLDTGTSHCLLSPPAHADRRNVVLYQESSRSGEQEVRCDVLLLQATKGVAPYLQLPHCDLSRVPEMLSALRVREAGEAAGVCAADAAGK
jgi:hypothetical protein